MKDWTDEERERFVHNAKILTPIIAFPLLIVLIFFANYIGLK